jgi:hypothetical protein
VSTQYATRTAHAFPATRPHVTRREGLRLCEYFLTTLTGYGAGQLEVVLVPAPEPKHSGHMVRCVANQNPRWYQHFCSLYTAHRARPRTGRKHDTLIKRRETVRALEIILEGSGESFPAVERLKEFVRRYGPRYLRECS